jgi:short-subunit dehydrogenase
LDAPVDTLVVNPGALAEPVDGPDPGRSIGDPSSLVCAIGDKMRQRGRGDIVLLSPLAGRAAPGDPATALRLAAAFRSDGATLRRKSRAAGVMVAVVVPASLAIRVAARFREPSLATDGADRVAEQTLRGVRRRRALIQFPGRAVLLMGVLRLLALRVRQGSRALLPNAAAISEPVDEPTIAGKSATGAAGD